MNATNRERVYTVEEYFAWTDERRLELIGGRIFDMAPAPFLSHQLIAGEIFRQLANQLGGTPCIAGIAPADVVLSGIDVVQPDVFVLCDRSKIVRNVVRGAPDAVFEVLSRSTSKKDRWLKKDLYEKSGVREYILVEPEGRFAERYTLLETGVYDGGGLIAEDGVLTLRACGGLSVDMNEVFAVLAAVEEGGE